MLNNLIKKNQIEKYSIIMNNIFIDKYHWIWEYPNSKN